MKRFAAALLLCAALTAVGSTAAFAAGSATPTTTAAPAQGAQITVVPGAAPITAFPPPENCGCHTELQAQFKQSMHAKALTDKAYLYKLKQAEAATGGELGPFCNTCHGPAATMAGEFQPGGKVSPAGGNGVYCSFCHQVTGTKHPPANVSQTLELGTFLAQLPDPKAPHPAAMSEFSSTGEFCGACHDVKHPGNGMHLESAYKEWKESPYAAQGVTCQDCHMGPAGPGSAPFSGKAAVTGPQRNGLFAMTFAGGNVGQGNADLATQQLKAAATVTIDVTDVASPTVPATATVTVSNVGAGHYLPTGLTEVRQMWLEVTATMPDGSTKVLKEHHFGTTLKDAKGRAPVELWEATGVATDDRIPPKGSSVDTVTIEVPSANGVVEVKAELKYKSLPDDFAKNSGVPNPTTVMASNQTKVFGSAAAKAAANQKPEPAASTSNVGIWVVIGLLALVVIGAIAWFVLRGRAE